MFLFFPHRFLGICLSSRGRITRRTAGRIILFIWTWAALLALPWVFAFKLANADEIEPRNIFCIEMWPGVMDGKVYFVIVNFLLFYLFPLTLISLCYFGIWLRVRSRHVPQDSISRSNVEGIHSRAKASVLKTVLVVVVLFALSWLPLYVIFMRVKLVSVEPSLVEQQVLDFAMPMAQWLGASHSCVNPFVYACFNWKFRRAFCRLLNSWGERRKDVKVYRSSSRTRKRAMTPMTV